MKKYVLKKNCIATNGTKSLQNHTTLASYPKLLSTEKNIIINLLVISNKVNAHLKMKQNMKIINWVMK